METVESLSAANRARTIRDKENHALPPASSSPSRALLPTKPRHTLVETYSVPSTPSTSQVHPTSGSKIPTLRRRTAQQTEADFVQRTERSVARHMQQQQQQRQQQQQTTIVPVRPTANNGRLRSVSISSQASCASQTSHTTSRTALGPHPSATTANPTTAVAMPPSRRTNDPFVPTYLWQRPAPAETVVLRRPRCAPGVLFAALPGDVLERILDHLRRLHLAEGSASCATCWMRDACAVAVSARKMLKYARAALYEHVELVGADSARQRKGMKVVHVQQLQQRGTRLVLLRRTLRGNALLAAIVRTLKVPCVDATGRIAASDTAYQDLVASVVMACPNLERVVGFHPPYDPTRHSRFVDALSRRARLREINWIIEPVPVPVPERQRQQTQQRQPQHHRGHVRTRSRSKSFSQVIWPQTPPESPTSITTTTALPPSPALSSSSLPSTPPPLDGQQRFRFLEHHANWPYLTTLTVHCKPGATLAPSTLLVDALTRLPALRNLYLAHLPADAFNDAALLLLPPLRRLTLVGLSGVTSDGLSAFASQTAAALQANGRSVALTALTLVHMRVDALAALARILSRLTALQSFALVQPQPPTLAPGEAIWLFPYLVAPSLRSLHWDVTRSTDEADTRADVIVARSIAAGGFPQLRRLRAPADPDGLFQALCRPPVAIALPGDKQQPGDEEKQLEKPEVPVGPQVHRSKHRRSASSGSRSFLPSSRTGHTRTDSIGSSSSSAGSAGSAGSGSASASTAASTAASSAVVPKMHSDLREARLAAQARLDAARRVPHVLVRVTDTNGTLVSEFGIGGYFGTFSSPIVYDLMPDPGASDARGGLVDLEAFLGPLGETLSGVGARSGEKAGESLTMEGCIGRWNANWDAPPKKDRDRWWHTERGRWHGAVLM